MAGSLPRDFDPLLDLVYALGKPAGGDGRLARHLVVGRVAVHASDLEPVQTQLLGDEVYLGLRAERRLGCAEPSHGGGWNRIGVHPVPVVPVSLPLVRKGVEETREVQGRGPHARVRPAFGEDAGLSRHERAVLLHPGPHVVVHRRTALRGNEVLFTAEHDLHRFEELHGENRCAELGTVELELPAEPSAHVVCDHPNVALPYPQHTREERLHVVRRLGRGPHGEFAVRAVIGHGRAGLHAHVRLARTLEPVLSDIVRLLERLFRISPLDVARHVDIALHTLVDLGGLLLDRLHRIVHAGEYLILHFDQVQRLLCDLFGNRRHRGHRFPDVPNLLHREDLLVAQLAIPPPYPLLHPERVLTRHHSLDPGEFQRLGKVDVLDLRMGMRAPEDLAVQHARTRDVDGVLRSSGHLRYPVYIMGVRIEYVIFHAWSSL